MTSTKVLSRTTGLLIFVAFAAIIFPSIGAEPVRLCSEGYFYSGDDDKTCSPYNDIRTRTYWTEEVGSSPVYSCYKYMVGEGFNDAYSECRRNKEAEIVSFEDPCEAKRFFRKVALNDDGRHVGDNNRTMIFLTSAQFYPDIDKWVWLGSDPYKNPLVYNITVLDDKNRCLAVQGTWNRAELEDQQDGFDIQLDWIAVPCNNNITFACEIRSKTVTMVTWFYTNWITVSLMFLVMVLVISLCVSAFTHNRASPAQRSAYRSSSSPSAHQGRGVVGVVTSDPAGDDPPKYSDVARLDTAPIPNNATTSPDKTNMDRYVGKGKELLGKIYLYKP